MQADGRDVSGKDHGIMNFKPDGSVVCLQCKKPIVYEGVNQFDPPLSLTCRPSEHVFCSTACFRWYQRSKNRPGTDRSLCPVCRIPISQEVYKRAGIQSESGTPTLRPQFKREPTECSECKEVKPGETYTCGHSLCVSCYQTLKEKLKNQPYDPKPGQDPNCLFCRKPSSWLGKAKDFATSDTGLSVLKNAGEYGYRYCCADSCSVM